MASSWSQIGQLSTDRGDPRPAVAWHLRALAVRLRLKSPQVAITLSRLRTARDALGAAEFDGAALEEIGRGELAEIHELLDTSAPSPSEGF